MVFETLNSILVLFLKTQVVEILFVFYYKQIKLNEMVEIEIENNIIKKISYTYMIENFNFKNTIRIMLL